MPVLLQINVTANWGSTGKIAEEIGNAAIAEGWDSYIAYGRNCRPSKSNMIDVGSRLNTYLHYFSQRLFDNEGLCSRRSTLRLVHEIQRIKPDIVHLHNIHDHYLNYRILFEYLNSTDIKVVWTMHDFWAVTGHCMHFVSLGCDRYKRGCYDCPMRKVYPKAVVDRSSRNYMLKKRLFTSNNNLSVVAVSQWVGDMLKTSFLSDMPINVINNGINLSDFKPTKVLDKFKFEGKFIIMSVASQWKFDKGLDDYKRMAEMLADDEIIVLVGVDDEIMKDLPDGMVGIKRTTDVIELASLYTRADVVTILSSAETFGLTVVEGYACGTPAVVYNNTAPPSLITPDTGYVVGNNDYKAAYNAIQQIKKAGKKHYSEACIRLARDKYDKNTCSHNYIALYHTILEKSN